MHHRPSEGEHEPILQTITMSQTRTVPDTPDGKISAYFAFTPPPPVEGGRLTLPDVSVAANITLVAGPGVSIELSGFPPSYIPSASVPALEIYRVQNPRALPTLGAPFKSDALTRSYFVDLTFDADGQLRTGVGNARQAATTTYFDSRIVSVEAAARYHNFTSFLLPVRPAAPPINPFRQFGGGQPSVVPPRAHQYLEIYRLPYGAVFKHPHSATDLYVSVPQFTNLSRPPRERDDHARFAYEIMTDAGPYDALLRIIKTGRVQVFASISDVETAVREPVFFEVYETDNLSEVPPQGAVLNADRRGWRRVEAVRAQFPDSPAEYFMMIADMSIGAIPLLGDIVDIGEFTLAVITNRDRWGRRVSTTEKWLMGVGAVLPFVSAAAVRGTSLVARFGARHDSARSRGGGCRRDEPLSGSAPDDRSVV